MVLHSDRNRQLEATSSLFGCEIDRNAVAQVVIDSTFRAGSGSSGAPQMW